MNQLCKTILDDYSIKCLKQYKKDNGRKPEIAYEDLQKTYNGLLEQGFVKKIKKMAKYTGVPHEIETRKKIYYEKIKKMTVEQAREIQEETGLEKMLTSHSMIHKIEKEKYTFKKASRIYAAMVGMATTPIEGSFAYLSLTSTKYKILGIYAIIVTFFLGACWYFDLIEDYVDVAAGIAKKRVKNANYNIKKAKKILHTT